MAKTRKPKKPKPTKKPAKERAGTFHKKLKVNTDFEGLVKALVTPKSPIKKK